MESLILRKKLNEIKIFLNYDEEFKASKINQKIYQERKSKNQKGNFRPKATRNSNFTALSKVFEKKS
jgi:hypothetical protein